ncbi:hypothetical protein PMAYCL1PPCAC_05614, partial [Pristionchus mayeri]
KFRNFPRKNYGSPPHLPRLPCNCPPRHRQRAVLGRDHGCLQSGRVWKRRMPHLFRESRSEGHVRPSPHDALRLLIDRRLPYHQCLL